MGKRKVKCGKYKLTKLVRQPYLNMEISAGIVRGHPIDTVFLRLEHDGRKPTTILFRPDELAAVAWCASGVVWSETIAQHLKEEK